MPWTVVSTTSTTNEFHPVTGWIDAAPFNMVRCTFEIATINGNMTLSPAYQVADNADNPGTSYALLASFDSTVDVFYPAQWVGIESNLANKQLIRFGWIVKNSSGSALSTARVSGRMAAQVG